MLDYSYFAWPVLFRIIQLLFNDFFYKIFALKYSIKYFDKNSFFKKKYSGGGQEGTAFFFQTWLIWSGAKVTLPKHYKRSLVLTHPPMLVCDFIKSRGFSLKNLLSNFSIIRERNPFSDSRVRSDEQICVFLHRIRKIKE